MLQLGYVILNDWSVIVQYSTENSDTLLCDRMSSVSKKFNFKY